MSWGNTYKTALTKLKTIHNKAIRVIFYVPQRESATAYYTILDILKLENIFKQKLACFTYKLIYEKDQTPEIFHNFIELAKETHSYNTRFSSRLNLHKPKVRTNYGIHTFKFAAVAIWEMVPMELKTEISVKRFKQKYRTFLLKYQI